MGNWSSNANGNDRSDRFIQNPQGGILMYNKIRVADLIDQFESARPISFQAMMTGLIILIKYCFQDILNELESDLNLDKNNFRTSWTLAKKTFTWNPSKYRNALKMSGGEDFPDECHIALICYTMGYKANSVYAKFNEECRSVCGGSLEFSQIANKSMFFLIRYVMENKDESSKRAIPAKLYRGCKGRFTAGKGKILSFGMFTSTTVNRSRADEFAEGCGTIFIINDAGNKYVKTRGINMRYHSDYSYEEEYLLSPFQLYRVTDVKQMNWLFLNKTLVYLDTV